MSRDLYEYGAPAPIDALQEAMGRWVEDCRLEISGGIKMADISIALSPELDLSTGASNAQVRQAMLARAETHIETALGLGWIADIDPPEIELGGSMIGTWGAWQILHEGRLRMRLRWPS